MGEILTDALVEKFDRLTAWIPSNDVNEFWQPHNTMCGDVITLVSMMYIITYVDSIVGVHSFIPAMQELIQNWGI